MAEISLRDLYPSPWGIVEHRRAEIESGAYGAFDKAVREEIEKIFYPIDRVAILMKCHPSTARKWLWADERNPRYIMESGVMLYHKDDVEATIAHRDSVKAEKKKKVAA